MRLLRLGADVNAVVEWIEEGGDMSITPLIGTATFGHARLVTALIENGADVNQPKL